MLCDPDLFIKPKDVAGCDPVDDLRRSKTVDLMLKDVAQPLGAVRKLLLHLLTLIKTFDDLRDIQTGFHIQIDKGLILIIKASGILLLQNIDHVFHHIFGCEDLVGLLRRDIVKNVFHTLFIKIVGEFLLQCHELHDGIVKDHRIEQLPFEFLFLSGLRINILPAVTQKPELLQRDTCHFHKHLIRDDMVKSSQRDRLIAVCHEERRNGTGESAQMIPDPVFYGIPFPLSYPGLHRPDRILRGTLREGVHRFVDLLPESLFCLLLLPAEFGLDLFRGLPALMTFLHRLRPLLLDHPLLDLIVLHGLVHHAIGFRVQPGFQLPFVGCFHLRAIVFLCGLHNIPDNLFLDQIL